MYHSFERAMSTHSILLTLVLTLASLALAYDATTCCSHARDNGAFTNTLPSGLQPICNQTYAEDIPGAPALMITYDYCTNSCPGIGIASLVKQPAVWLMPVFQFIFPAVIFSMIVPRRKNLDASWLLEVPLSSLRWGQLPVRFGLQYFVRAPAWLLRASIRTLLSIPCLTIIVVDNAIWVAVIVVTAAQMLIEGLYEAQLDHNILRTIALIDDEDKDQKLELMITVVSGNLRLTSGGFNPQEAIANALHNQESPREADFPQTSARLISLMSSQTPFGTAVGIPVLFYLGGFAYTLLSLLDNKSDQNTAIAMAFGVEWMVVVHVSIVGACLLAGNNPATATAIVGHMEPDVTQPHRAPTLDVGQVDPPGDHPGSAPGGTSINAPAGLPGNPTGDSQDDPINGTDISLSNVSSRAPLMSGQQADAQSSMPQASTQQITDPMGPATFVDPVHRRATSSKYGVWKEAYPGAFQPVSMTSRGSNKHQWVCNTEAFRTREAIRDKVEVSWWQWFFILLPTAVLVVLPPVAGGIISWVTPPRGYGCRSLLFIVYAGVQSVLTITSALQTIAHGRAVSSMAVSPGPAQPAIQPRNWWYRYIWRLLDHCPQTLSRVLKNKPWLFETCIRAILFLPAAMVSLIYFFEVQHQVRGQIILGGAASIVLFPAH
jgi:hypothetical protein